MTDVMLALLPATVIGCVFFGWNALLVVVISTVSAVATEALIQLLTKKKVTIGDMSAALTGLLLGLNLPPSVPLWVPIIGSAFAVAIVKQVFGGLGYNFINPALAARAMLQISWPSIMTTWSIPFTLDAVSTGTPLALIKTGAEAVSSVTIVPPSILDLFLGNTAGCIGETSALALLIGGIYLMIRKVISWHIPVTYIGTVALFTFIAGPSGLFTGDALYHILAGGLFIGAFYMATDYVTSPVTPAAQIVFGIGCGVLTGVIRLFGGYPEGVCYSILLMNLAAPLLERAFKKRVYGEAAKHEQA
jgi:electron transport complex protein RnfD